MSTAAAGFAAGFLLFSCFHAGPRHALVAGAAAGCGGCVCGRCSGVAAVAQGPLVTPQEAGRALSTGPAAGGFKQQESGAAGGAGDTLAAPKPSAQLGTEGWQGRVNGWSLL